LSFSWRRGRWNEFAVIGVLQRNSDCGWRSRRERHMNHWSKLVDKTLFIIDTLVLLLFVMRGKIKLCNDFVSFSSFIISARRHFIWQYFFFGVSSSFISRDKMIDVFDFIFAYQLNLRSVLLFFLYESSWVSSVS